MSKNKVEENAVIEVRNIMKKSDKILSKNVKEGDKEQSTDGFLSIYLENPDKKTNFYNNIDVQVKGRTSKNLPTAKNINFQMEIQDLENYKKLGGCIVFFVAFTKDFKDFNIYIKPLLPYEINIILRKGKKSKNEKNVSIRFKEVDKDDYLELERICYQFQQDKNKQYSYKEKNYTLQDLKNEKGQFEISWSVPKNYELKTIDMFNEDKFMYFIPDGLERVKIPVGMGKIHSVGFKIDNETIEINNKEYKVNIEMEKMQNDTIYKIGNSIIYNETKEYIYINLAGSFNMMDREIEIVENLIKYGKLTLGNKTIEVELKNVSIVHNQIDYIRKLQKICEVLRIEDEIFVDFRDKESIKNIQLLNQGIINKKTIDFQCTYGAFVCKLKIFNINIAIFAKKEENTPLYKIMDLFEELMNDSLIYFKLKGKIINIQPKFAIFQQSKFMGFENSILTSANIINKYNDLLLILKKFEKNPINEKNLNSFELELIKTYDKIKDIRILEFAQKINEFLINIQGENEVNIINYYQIEYRKRNLTQEEIQKLVLLKNSTNEDMAKACICILLHYNIEYEMLYSNFNDETKQFFNTLPIYNLIGSIKEFEELNNS